MPEFEIGEGSCILTKMFSDHFLISRILILAAVDNGSGKGRRNGT